MPAPIESIQNLPIGSLSEQKSQTNPGSNIITLVSQIDTQIYDQATTAFIFIPSWNEYKANSVKCSPVVAKVAYVLLSQKNVLIQRIADCKTKNNFIAVVNLTSRP